jgi:hypothetical protein
MPYFEPSLRLLLLRRHPIPAMALWRCQIPFPPLRATSLRPKFNPGQIQRICVPNAPALFHTTRSSMQTTKALTTPRTWVDRLPTKAQPYLYLTRIDKPIGTLLLFYPCGASSAAPGLRWRRPWVGLTIAIANTSQPGQSRWPHTRSTPRHLSH